MSATAASASDIALTWQNGSSGGTGFRLERSADGVTFEVIAELGANRTTYADTGLRASTPYYYRVAAYNAAGASPYSNTATATTLDLAPLPPAAVTAAGSAAQVTISWDDVQGAASYDLYWSNASGVSKANGTKIAGVTSPYVHQGLSNGVTYYYVVTSEGAGGEGAESTEASATPDIPAPGAPQGVTAMAGNASVALSWTPLAGAEAYNVYWSTTSGVSKTSGNRISGVGSPPYTHGGLRNGTTYYYVVTATGSGGESPASTPVSAVPNSSKWNEMVWDVDRWGQ